MYKLCSLDNAFCDQFARKNAPENIDENCLNFWVSVEYLKSGFDLVNISTTTDIEEISRRSTVEFNDVHGAHCETSTVNKTADISVKRNIWQSSFNCFFFMRINIFTGHWCFSKFNEFWLSEFSIVIDVNFGIYAKERILRISSPRVDFNLSCVKGIEHFVDVFDLILGICSDFS